MDTWSVVPGRGGCGVEAEGEVAERIAGVVVAVFEGFEAVGCGGVEAVVAERVDEAGAMIADEEGGGAGGEGFEAGADESHAAHDG